jgi:bifunctional non-homologous end joining protein LigD
VRLFTRNGHDWTSRYPRIVAAALRNRNSSFVIDGEAVLLDANGHSDFNGLHSRKQDAEIELYAFDCLALAGDDLRGLPLHRIRSDERRLGARKTGAAGLSYVDGHLMRRVVNQRP